MSYTSTGLSENVSNFIAYLFGWVSGLALFFVEKNNTSIHFNAAQSMVLFGSLTVLNLVLPVIPALGPLLMVLLAPVSMILWLVLMFMSLTGNPPRLPVVANFADQIVSKYYPVSRIEK
jgi:uncharacterized membrane protein